MQMIIGNRYLSTLCETKQLPVTKLLKGSGPFNLGL